MRTTGRWTLLVALLAVAAAGSLPGRADSRQEAAPDPPRPSCANSCRGLGIEKVKAGDEHCGLISRERKDESLDAACTLAESHREELQARAETRARRECSEQLDPEACSCQTGLRPWQNVYTHVFSQRCWAECGWAFLIECDRRTEAEED